MDYAYGGSYGGLPNPADGVDVEAESPGGMGVATNSDFGSSPDRSRVVNNMDDSNLVPRRRKEGERAQQDESANNRGNTTGIS